VADTWQLGTGEERARVAIVGCGGAGCNTLRHVGPPPNAERIALNDTPHASMAGIRHRVLVPAGPLPAIASLEEKTVPTLATNEERDLSNVLLNRDLVVALGGLGGQLGGWAMAVVARVARILGEACVALATLPFTAEGAVRREAAEAQLEALRRRADAVVAFANDGLLRVAPDLPLTRAFAALGSVMARPAVGLPSVLSKSDVAPLKRMLAKAKEWRFGMGVGTERHRCFLAVEEAYRSPWFTGRAEGVQQAIVLIGQPTGMTVEAEVLHEVRIRSPLADLAWGTLPEPTTADRVTVQLLAGF